MLICTESRKWKVSPASFYAGAGSADALTPCANVPTVLSGTCAFSEVQFSLSECFWVRLEMWTGLGIGDAATCSRPADFAGYRKQAFNVTSGCVKHSLMDDAMLYLALRRAVSCHGLCPALAQMAPKKGKKDHAA